ncbi:MAG TPA: hypothetical protein VNE41_10330 [Chitinophagaceae bacterium]|nr:hypothetical protein [Chitinophagaceae bacterium]
MSNKVPDPLFVLVKTLSKAEKRHFQLSTRNKIRNKEMLYIRLFGMLDKMEVYDETTLIKKIPGIKKSQLPNLKAHLYRQLLSSLRGLYRLKDPVMELRELFDYARVLYDKGLYPQSKHMLGRIKPRAQMLEEISLSHEVIEFEKLIESRYITPGLESRTALLSLESRQLSRQLSSISYLSTLSLRMYGLYLKMGHARDEKDARILKDFLELHLPAFPDQDLGFYEKTYLYQTYCWYYYTLQDFALYYRYCRKWVDLFEKLPQQKTADPSLYLKALHNLLTAYFYTRNQERFTSELQIMAQFIREKEAGFEENTRLYAFVYLSTARINKHFLEGTFSEGLNLVAEIENQIRIYQAKLDDNRVMVFYYKIACLYFGSGDNGNAIKYLHRIIQLRVGNLREDIQCFARILHLIAHFEMENFSLVEYLVKSVYHFIAQHRDQSRVMEEIMLFLRKNLYARPDELLNGFRELREQLLLLSKNPFEKRSFLYLDIISWLESRISGIPVQTVIRNKFLQGIARF